MASGIDNIKTKLDSFNGGEVSQQLLAMVAGWNLHVSENHLLEGDLEGGAVLLFLSPQVLTSQNICLITACYTMVDLICFIYWFDF